MNPTQTPERSAGGEAGSANSSGLILRLISYSLTGLLLIAISTSVYFTHRIIGIFDDTVQMSRKWTERLGQYSELQVWELMIDTFAQGAVLDPRDIEADRLKANAMLGRFNQLLAAAHEDIRNDRDLAAKDAKLLSADIGRIETGRDEMVAETELVFSFLKENQRGEAGAHALLAEKNLSICSM